MMRSRHAVARHPARKQTRWSRRLIVELLERRDLPSLVTAPSIPVGNMPQSMAVGDLNADGLDDVAVGSYGANGGVSVLLATGNGSFLPANHYSSGFQTRNVVSADVNGDGVLDLLAANSTFPLGSISVLIGRGDGTFKPAVNYAAGEQPSAVAVTDFNNDGKPDLAVSTDAKSATIKVFLGNGNGLFTNPTDYAAGGYVYAVSAADFNQDGAVDLAVANALDNTVSILLGNGNGSLSSPTPITVGSVPVALVSADLNGDGKVDLAVANSQSGSVSILRGNGDGSFRPPVNFSAGGTPYSVVAADLDGDADFDLVVPNRDDTTVTVLRNQFGAFRRRNAYITDGGPYGVAAGRFTNDATVDFVTANTAANSISVFVGTGGGAFYAAHPQPGGKLVLDMTTADFNLDGDPDIAAISSEETADVRGTILTDNGGGTFDTSSLFVGTVPYATASSDFDGDGVPDLAVANADSGTIDVFKSIGDGTFQIAPQYKVRQGSRTEAVADFNRDGNLDVAVAVLTGVVQILPGAGDGTFGPAVTYPSGSKSTGIAVADFNADGMLDIVVSNNIGNGTVTLLLGNGDGSFKAPTSYRAGQWPSDISVADADGDGDGDVIVLNVINSAPDTVSVLLNNGDGTFQPPRASPCNNSSAHVATGDFNGDGLLDLTVTNPSDGSGKLSILVGNGDGTFHAPVSYAVTYPDDVNVGDFNSDGKQDLVTSGYKIRIWLGNGNGTFQPPTSFTSDPGSGQLQVGDLDGDSHLDVAVSHYDVYLTAVSLWHGNGNGSLGSPVLYIPGDSPIDLAAGDFNHDGRLDFATLNTMSVGVLLAEGSGFAGPRAFHAGVLPDKLTLGDFNHDGRPDLAVGTVFDANTGGVAILLNQGGLHFAAATYYPTVDKNDTPLSIVTDDFDSDGNLDVVTSNTLSNQASTIAILFGNSDGTLQSAVYYVVATPQLDLAVGDFNGDGRLDLASTISNGFNILLGNGDGTFLAPTTYAAGFTATDMGVADVNADGALDIVTTRIDGYAVALFIGNSDGTFAPARFYVAGTKPSMLVIADVDRNGWLDVVVGEYTSVGRMTVLLNDGNWSPLPISGAADPAIRLITERRPPEVPTLPRGDEKRMPEDRSLRVLATDSPTVAMSATPAPGLRPALCAPRADVIGELNLDLA